MDYEYRVTVKSDTKTVLYTVNRDSVLLRLRLHRFIHLAKELYGKIVWTMPGFVMIRVMVEPVYVVDLVC